MLNLNSGTPSKRLSRMALFIFCGMLLCSLVLLGQSTVGTGSIRGAVTDPTNAVLAGAKVTFVNKATAGVVRWQTSTEGSFSSGPLMPGNYTLRVEVKGFKTAEISMIVRVGIASFASVKMQVGPESPAVISDAGEPLLNTEQATVQGVLPGRQIENLPVSGRSLFDFAQLDPGVQVQDSGSLLPGKNGFSSISFLGRYGRAARVEVDGVDASDEIFGGTTQNIAGSAIQEFNLSHAALDLATELGSTGTVSVITRSGGNALHGEGFGFFRGHQGGASLPGAEGLPFQQEQFGGRVGGALVKDKIFGFLDVQRMHQNVTAAIPFAAPFNELGTTLAEPFREWQADGRLDWQRHDNAHAFYRFNFDESSQIRPFGATSSLQAFNTESHTPSQTLGYDFNTGLYTHSIRFGYSRFWTGTTDSTAGLAAGVDNPIPGVGINVGAPVQGNCALSGGGAYCGGPSGLAPRTTVQSNYELRYDGSRLVGNHIFRYGAVWNRMQGAVSAAKDSNPQVGTTSICLPASTPLNCVTSADPTSYQADFLFMGNGIGFATAKSAFGYAGGGLEPDNRIEAYLGDAWKVKPNFTLSYGLRYVHDTGRLDSSLGTTPALNSWSPGLGNAIRNPGNNVAPQIGFAWDAGNTGKTFIRGGAGLYYETSLWNNTLFDSPARLKQGNLGYAPEICSSGNPTPFAWPTNPGLVGAQVAGGAGVVVAGVNQVQPTFCGGTISAVAADILALSNAFKAAAAANGASQANTSYVGTSLNVSNAAGLAVFDPNYRTPRSWQLNLGFQHEIEPGLVFSADYIRNIGEHYLIGIDQNHSGAARSYNLANALSARDAAQLAHGCLAGIGQGGCMVENLGQAGAQAAYSSAGMDSNIAVAAGAPCPACAFPGITPNGSNNNGAGSGNGSLGALDMLEPVGRSLYSGYHVKLVQTVSKPWWGWVKAANFQFSYTYSKFSSQAQDQDYVNLATNNDNVLEFTGPNAMDRKHQVSFGGTFELPFFTRVSLMGHFYSPLPQTLQLPQLTNGGEIFATDWLGSGLGSGAPPEPLPGTGVGQFMRGTDVADLVNVISKYNTHFAGSLTPAGHCLVADGLCPGAAPIAVMTQSDMQSLGWVMPQIASVAPDSQNLPWFKSLDVKAAWPIKIGDHLTVEPSVSAFNVLNIANFALPGNVPLGSLLPGGTNATLGPNSVGGVTGPGLRPFRAGFQSGTYSLGAPRQLEFGLRVQF